MVKEERAHAEHGLKPGRSAHCLLGQCSHQGKTWLRGMFGISPQTVCLGFSHCGMAWNICVTQVQPSYLGSQGKRWKLRVSLIS